MHGIGGCQGHRRIYGLPRRTPVTAGTLGYHLSVLHAQPFKSSRTVIGQVAFKELLPARKVIGVERWKHCYRNRQGLVGNVGSWDCVITIDFDREIIIARLWNEEVQPVPPRGGPRQTSAPINWCNHVCDSGDGRSEEHT